MNTGIVIALKKFDSFPGGSKGEKGRHAGDYRFLKSPTGNQTFSISEKFLSLIN
jgi:hypothetical protein